MNETIRRQDRVLEEEKAATLLNAGEYGVLSMQAESGGGYGVPVNFVWDGATRYLQSNKSANLA